MFCAIGVTLNLASSYCLSNSSLPLAVECLSKWMWQGFISSFKNMPADASGSQLAGLTFAESFSSQNAPPPRGKYRSRRSRSHSFCLSISQKGMMMFWKCQNLPENCQYLTNLLLLKYNPYIVAGYCSGGRCNT